MRSIETRIESPISDAEVAVREALAAEGFGVLSEIDVAATLKAKLGLERPPLKILGACNPTLASSWARRWRWCCRATWCLKKRATVAPRSRSPTHESSCPPRCSPSSPHKRLPSSQPWPSACLKPRRRPPAESRRLPLARHRVRGGRGPDHPRRHPGSLPWWRDGGVRLLLSGRTPWRPELPGAVGRSTGWAGRVTSRWVRRDVAERRPARSRDAQLRGSPHTHVAFRVFEVRAAGTEPKNTQQEGHSFSTSTILRLT